eukprot:m.470103 g.470103  ORF g.470103 m.470103 type:complete len:200 (-) comp29393_c0_seq1:145-744(-)
MFNYTMNHQMTGMEVSPKRQEQRVGVVVYAEGRELHREAKLRTTKDLIDAHYNVNNNIAVVTALLGGFGFSFATQDLNIGVHAREHNVWSDDELVKEWWTFSVVLMAMVTLITCFTAINNAQQIAQCPEPLFKRWFCSKNSTLMAVFWLLGLCYLLFIVVFTMTCSLILRKWMFRVAVVIFGVLFVIIGVGLMFRLASS